jgi:hypothetical protein
VVIVPTGFVSADLSDKLHSTRGDPCPGYGKTKHTATAEFCDRCGSRLWIVRERARTKEDVLMPEPQSMKRESLTEQSELPTPGWGPRIAGWAMILLGLLLSAGVAPMLLQARDQRDLVGGIAGSVIIAILVGVGVFLAFPDWLPRSLIRLFYLVFGVLAVFVGVTTFGWLSYNLLIERQESFQLISVRQLFLPFVEIAVGVIWLRKFITGKDRNESSSESALFDH